MSEQHLRSVQRDPLAPRIFLECTSTHASRYNTGIQRAVRNLVNASLAIAPCNPVVYNGRYFETVDALPYQVPAGRAKERSFAIDRMRRAFHSARSSIVRGVPSRVVRDALFSPRLEYALRRVVYAAQNVRRWARSYRSDAAPQVEFRHGDVLVLLDSTWSVDLTRELARARNAGVRIWVVVNDLIPIEYPDLAPEGSSILVDKWLRRTVPYAHGLLGISRAVAEGLRQHLWRSGISLVSPRIEFFYLGAGIATASHDESPLTKIRAAFEPAGGAVYLCVGTVEPRKQHPLVIDAFEQLWREGVGAKLVIFGRHGWRSDDLSRRIRTHPEFGQRLVWIDQGSDAELDYAYRQAAALIFASRCEGFGLPLVEAMQYGLPVIASDIPVFREIGGDYPLYFELDRAEALVGALLEFERQRALGPISRRPHPWLTWSDSARMLLETVAGDAA